MYYSDKNIIGSLAKIFGIEDVETMLKHQTNKPQRDENVGLSLRDANLTPEYCKKWNTSMDDLCHLYYNGVKLSNTLYRKGGMYSGNFNDSRYYLILKYEEAYHTKEDMKRYGLKNKEHLNYKWVIIDQEGKEKKVFNHFEDPYLVDKNGIIYTLKNAYYNIETGEMIAKSVYSTVKSKEYLFIENNYDEDEDKRGVIKVKVSDGTWELFK